MVIPTKMFNVNIVVIFILYTKLFALLITVALGYT